MKKSVISLTMLCACFLFFFGKTGMLSFTELSELKSTNTSSTNDFLSEEIDETSINQSAIKRKPDLNLENIKENIDESKIEIINEILTVSGVDSYQENIANGIESTLKSKADDPEKVKFIEEFSTSLQEYPFSEEFKEVLANYSEEELQHLLESFNHPANKEAIAVQKEKITELTEITKREDQYLASPEKQVIIDDIIEASNSIEIGTVIGDATTKPIFMAIHKNQNPKANIQEMEAFANKLIESTRAKQLHAMNNVMNWSFDQVAKDKLEDYRRFVNQDTDRKVNDKYLEDMKVFYGRYGKYIGKEMVKLMAKLK